MIEKNWFHKGKKRRNSFKKLKLAVFLLWKPLRYAGRELQKAVSGHTDECGEAPGHSSSDEKNGPEKSRKKAVFSKKKLLTSATECGIFSVTCQTRGFFLRAFFAGFSSHTGRQCPHMGK